MTQTPDNCLFDEDRPEQVAEYLQLTLDLLKREKISANPINYDLFYTYVAGKDSLLNEKIDEFLEGEKVWNHAEAKQLFQRFFASQAESCFEDIREELLKIVATSLGALIDIAGKTSLSNKQLKSHVEKLASASKPEEILTSVSLILDEARAFVTHSTKLESDLMESAREIEVLKTNLINSSREVETLKTNLRNARNEALTDPLTGLFNRRGFDHVIQETITSCQGNDSCFSLLMADMDHFKNINDSHGHLLGDKVLSEFALIMKNHMRNRDFLARYGGEEFVMIMPHTTLSEATSIAEDIRLAVTNMQVQHDTNREVISDLTVSLGVAQFKSGETFDSFIERCDGALYSAKHSGRNCVVAASD